jgi:hypothetical protein
MAPTRIPKFLALSTEGAADYRRACKISSAAWNVLLALCQHADYRTAYWTGRLDFLAEVADLSRWTVARQLEWLDAEGHIYIERPFGRGNGAPASIYVCAYSELRQDAGPGRMVQSATRMVQVATNDPPGMVQSATNEQGTSSLHLTATHGTWVAAGGDDSDHADEPALRPASSDSDEGELSHEAWQAGRAALKRAKAKGTQIGNEQAYVKAVARKWTPGKEVLEGSCEGS